MSVVSVLTIGIIMIFCLHRFCPGMSWRGRRQRDSEPSTADVKQTFLDLGDSRTRSEKSPTGTQVQQTFLHLDDDTSQSERKVVDMADHPALRSLNMSWKRKHGSNGNESINSASSTTPLISRTDNLTHQPTGPHSPRVHMSETPPPVPRTGTEVRVSQKPIRPLPTPVQPVRSTHTQHPEDYDISPLQTSTTLPTRSQLPMSFLIEIDARREDQTGCRSRTVSPLPNPRPYTPDQSISGSQLSSRNVSPLSAPSTTSPSTTSVYTSPKATPVYVPSSIIPFSRYNPYRPPLEPASSKNWPLESITIPIPENSAMSGSEFMRPVRQPIQQSPPVPHPNPSSGLDSESSSTNTPTTSLTSAAEAHAKQPTITHPELDAFFLKEFHRHRRRQKAKGQKRQQQNKGKQQQEETSVPPTTAALLRSAKKFSIADDNGNDRDITPSPGSPGENASEKGRRRDAGVAVARARSRSRSRSATTVARRLKDANGAAVVREGKNRTITATTTVTISTDSTDRQRKKAKRFRLPPRPPSRRGKLSLRPEAYAEARRISGLHELSSGQAP